MGLIVMRRREPEWSSYGSNRKRKTSKLENNKTVLVSKRPYKGCLPCCLNACTFVLYDTKSCVYCILLDILQKGGAENLWKDSESCED